MDGYEYCPDANTNDKMSLLFQNICNLISFAPDDITKAVTVQRMLIPIQGNIEAMEFEDCRDLLNFWTKKHQS